MVKGNKILLGASSLVVVLAGGIIFMSFALKQDDVEPQTTELQQNTASHSPELAVESNSGETKDALTLTYSDDGYQPKTLRVQKGQSVKFTTTSEIPNWVASNPHPAHTDYPEFDTGQILGTLPAPGDETLFIFDKVGNWGFHNHNQPSQTGTIVVVE